MHVAAGPLETLDYTVYSGIITEKLQKRLPAVCRLLSSFAKELISDNLLQARWHASSVHAASMQAVVRYTRATFYTSLHAC